MGRCVRIVLWDGGYRLPLCVLLFDVVDMSCFVGEMLQSVFIFDKKLHKVCVMCVKYVSLQAIGLPYKEERIDEVFPCHAKIW